MEEQAEWWLRAVFNYGLPSVLILALGAAAWKGIRAVWTKAVEWIETLLETIKDFLAGISENDTKRTEAMHTLTMSGLEGHAKTHGKLEDVHADVRHIKERFEK